MGATPQQKDITIEFDCQFRVNMGRSDFSSIMKAFLMLLHSCWKISFRKYLLPSASTRCPGRKNHSSVNFVAMTPNL